MNQLQINSSPFFFESHPRIQVLCHLIPGIDFIVNLIEQTHYATTLSFAHTQAHSTSNCKQLIHVQRLQAITSLVKAICALAFAILQPGIAPLYLAACSLYLYSASINYYSAQYNEQHQSYLLVRYTYSSL